jgi:hypothetical protein
VKRGYTDKVTDEILSQWAEKEVKGFIEILTLKAKQTQKHPEILTGINFELLADFLACDSDTCVCPYCHRESHGALSTQELSAARDFLEDLGNLEEEHHKGWKSLAYNKKMKARYEIKCLGKPVLATLNNCVHMAACHSAEFLELIPTVLDGDLVQFLARKVISKSSEEARHQYDELSLREYDKKTGAYLKPPQSYNGAFGDWLKKQRIAKVQHTTLEDSEEG